MGDEPEYEYTVERDLRGAGRGDVRLVRRPRSRSGLRDRLRHHDDDEPCAIFARTFSSTREAAELERYAAALELVGRHANAGTLGCFVESRAVEGTVHVRLFERWFDGERLRCEELVHREFDPGQDATLVTSAELVAELQEWADRRNDQRELDDIEARLSAQERSRRALEHLSAAEQLARILRQSSSSRR